MGKVYHPPQTTVDYQNEYLSSEKQDESDAERRQTYHIIKDYNKEKTKVTSVQCCFLKERFLYLIIYKSRIFANEFIIRQTMKRILFSSFLSLITILSFATDKFTVADVFTDHMVLQRNAIIKIWGEAQNGSLVEVRFAGQLRKVKAIQGKWQVTLKTGEAGGPYKLDIINGNNKVSFQDVLIGDVWLAGGQSNMEFALRRVKDAQKEISSADYPQIRYYKVPRKFYPEHEVSKASWRVCSPQTAPEFSAIAYYFSRNIHKELNIPIGIIQTPVGGTTVEA